MIEIRHFGKETEDILFLRVHGRLGHEAVVLDLNGTRKKKEEGKGETVKDLLLKGQLSDLEVRRSPCLIRDTLLKTLKFKWEIKLCCGEVRGRSSSEVHLKELLDQLSHGGFGRLEASSKPRTGNGIVTEQNGACWDHTGAHIALAFARYGSYFKKAHCLRRRRRRETTRRMKEPFSSQSLKIDKLASFCGSTEKLINEIRRHHVLLNESIPTFQQDLDIVKQSGILWDTITGSVQQK